MTDVIQRRTLQVGELKQENLTVGDCAVNIAVDTSSLDKFLERIERAAKAARAILNEE